MERPLNPDEAALWARVMTTVRPLPGRAVRVPIETAPPTRAPVRSDSVSLTKSPPAARPAGPGTTLDSSWDRRIGKGQIVPDNVVDLHGETLNSAYARLDAALDHAIAHGNRVLLLITGRPPASASERPHRRGAIRAAVGDWLAASRHADAIAAVRGAHPRHGGAGALYVIFRRRRASSSPKS